MEGEREVCEGFCSGSLQVVLHAWGTLPCNPMHHTSVATPLLRPSKHCRTAVTHRFLLLSKARVAMRMGSLQGRRTVVTQRLLAHNILLNSMPTPGA